MVLACVTAFLFHMQLERKFLEPKINTNVAESDADTNDTAAVLTIICIIH